MSNNQNELTMDKLCLDCGKALKGRADKKFCDDQCRNNHNNKLNAEENFLIRKINKIIYKNRNLLKQMNPDGKIKIKKALLSKHGFDFDYYTHHYTTNNGNTYTFCYEHGYLLLENDEVLIVKREEQDERKT